MGAFDSPSLRKEDSWKGIPDAHWYKKVMGKKWRASKENDLDRDAGVQLVQLRTNAYTALGHRHRHRRVTAHSGSMACCRCGAERDDAEHYHKNGSALKKQRKQYIDGPVRATDPRLVARYVAACRDTLSDGRERGKRGKGAAQ